MRNNFLYYRDLQFREINENGKNIMLIGFNFLTF